MDMGQMIAVVQQMPAVQDVAAGNEVVGQMEQSSPFAGVLQSVTTPNVEQAQLMAQNASQEAPDWGRISQMQLDAVAALLAFNSNGAVVLKSETADLSPQEVTTDIIPAAGESESQNVKSDRNVLQVAQMLAQQHGILPGVDVNQVIPESQSAEAVVSAATVDSVVPFAGGGSAGHEMPKMVDNMGGSVHVNVAPKSQETGRPASSGDNPTVVRASDGLQEPVENAPGKLHSPQFQMETVVAESDKPVLSVEKNGSKPETVQSAVFMEKRTDLRSANSQRQGLDVTYAQPLAVKGLNQAVSADVAVKAPTPAAPAHKSTSLVVGTENRVLQLEIPVRDAAIAQRSMPLSEVQSTQISQPLETRLEVQVVTPADVIQAVKPAAPPVDVVALKQVASPGGSATSVLPEVSVPQPEIAQAQNMQHKVRTATPVVSVAAAPVVEVMPENNPVKINLREAVGSQNMETVDPVSNIVAVATNEKNFGSDGENFGQSQNPNVLSNTMHQQVKTEGLATVGTAAGTDASNLSRTSQPAEQVVQQVRERLVNHIAKPGSEQIVLRLSPEHLGDLRVNLNLDGQRLKVEIVAENLAVRDSLLQNTDLLKESLSRQNIKMESFDVTTGGNSMADNSRGQGEWRELAQRRQQNLWMPEGGYRMAKQAAPAVAAYQPKSQHTMVDVHF